MPCIFCDYKTLNYKGLGKGEKRRFPVSFGHDAGRMNMHVYLTLYTNNIKTMFAVSQVTKNPRNYRRL